MRQEAEEERIRKEEELENAKFHGTKVTVERFMEWKAKFEREMAEKENEERQARLKELKNKLTGKQSCSLRVVIYISSSFLLLGRQLFEQDRTLALSDAKYMDEGDVSVDISLYEREEHVPSEDEDDDKEAVWKRFGDDE